MTDTPKHDELVEAWLVERLESEGYGRARKVVDARIYDASSDDFWISAEARSRHRITRLAALQQPDERDEQIARLTALVRRAGEFACKAPQFDWNEDRCVMTAIHLAEDCRTALGASQ